MSENLEPIDLEEGFLGDGGVEILCFKV